MPKRLGHFALVILLAGCGGPRMSKQSAAKLVEGSADFKAAKLVYLPRQVAIPAEAIASSSASREGEALNIIQIASIDPVVAILRARDRVSIEDFVSAVPGSITLPKADTMTKADSAKADSLKADSLKKDSTKTANDSTLSDAAKAAHFDSLKPKPKPRPLSLNEPHTSPPPAPPLAQAWVHTLRVTPRPQLQSNELVADDGEDNPESPRVEYTTPQPVGRTPGWTLSVGTREFMRVLEVASYAPAVGDPPGDTQIDFLWRWKPTKSGAFFDTEGAEFQSLPREVQQAAQAGTVTVDQTIHWARATLARDGASWKLTSVRWQFGDDKPHEGW
jgi:hypothetical protein